MVYVVKNIWDKVIIFSEKIDAHYAFLYLILLSAFIIRVVNLNYNSAFNDEAIYVVIGRMGLFAHDWWSYGAKLWMAGLPYIYPPMSALAYELGGISGARLLNVIFGVLLVEEVYRFVLLLNLFDTKTNRIAALIACFLAAFSGIGIFVSKLATYDMPSFLLFIVGINSFLKAKNFTNGKYYFLTFFCLFAAFLTKITIAIFFPILFVISILIMKARSVLDKRRAITYLYVPFFLATLVYFVLYRDNLMTYIATHRDLGSGNFTDIINVIWEEAYILILLLIPSTFLLIASKKIKATLALIALSLVMPLFHLALLRFATLDKHMYLTVIFLSVIAGYGVSLVLQSRDKMISTIVKIGIPIVMLLYLLSSQYILNVRENDWRNSYATQDYLVEKIQPGDKILTEEGGAVILALYGKIFPPKSIVTFDWIDYSGLSGEKGYLQAINDEYFDYIELNGRYQGSSELREKIRESMAEKYYLTYGSGNYEVYEKNKK